MAENAIIEKIVNDAKSSRNAYIADANSKKEEIEKAYTIYAEKITAQTKSATETECANILERKNTVAILDRKKITLQAKQEVIDEAFDLAKQKILSDTAGYQKFMTAEILEHFEEGDQIITGKNEKALDAGFFKKLQAETDKKIVLSKEAGNFVGGVIIRSAGYDKNLCLDTIMTTIREDIEAQVSKILFE